MSITAAPEKNTLASTLFTIFTVVIALAGIALLYVSITWQPPTGQYVYLALGVTLAVAGVLLFRRRRSGLWLFGLASLATWIWGMMATRQSDGLAPEIGPRLPALPFAPLTPSEALLAGMALLGLVLLAFWPVARKRLVGVARPGYFIINGVLPAVMILTIVIGRLS